METCHEALSMRAVEATRNHSAHWRAPRDKDLLRAFRSYDIHCQDFHNAKIEDLGSMLVMGHGHGTLQDITIQCRYRHGSRARAVYSVKDYVLLALNLKSFFISNERLKEIPSTATAQLGRNNFVSSSFIVHR